MNDAVAPAAAKKGMPRVDDVPGASDGATASERAAALRIIDANFNRATEGLRVVEEYCRFGLNDAHLSRLAKSLRHDAASAMQILAPAALVAARETERDVGVAIGVEQEAVRSSLRAVAQANLKRVEQALRAIEEYGKLVSPALASQFEMLRYRAYTLAKAITTTDDSLQRLADARLYVLLDGRESECAFVERLHDLFAGGVDVIQLRDKRLDDRTLASRARLLRRTLDEAFPPGEGTNANRRPLFIVNDRPDIALLARADGVHVGQEELSVFDVRQIVGPEMLIGVSTHSIAQARQAVLDGANYLGCGPTFPSGTKHFEHFPGLDYLRQVVAEVALPAFAIGGITLDNLPNVFAAGFRRVAVGGAIATQRDAEALAATFRQRLLAAAPPDLTVRNHSLKSPE